MNFYIIKLLFDFIIHTFEQNTNINFMAKKISVEITNKIVVKSLNKFVLKALCEELLRYEFKYDPLVLSDNEAIIKIDLENMSLTLAEDTELPHYDIPAKYIVLIKKIESICRGTKK